MALPALPMVLVPFGELLGLANAYEQAGKLPEAERLAGYLLNAAPNQPDALHLAGLIAHRRGDNRKALEYVERAIEFAVDPTLYYRNVCELYRIAGRLDDAVVAAKRAFALAPSDPLCLHNLSIIHYERLEIREAIACAEQALVMNPTLPGAHFELAEALLLTGEMERGWDEYEWRYRIQGAGQLMPPTDKPQWDGAAFAGETLLLIADQGFGDVIQFCRYIPWVAERCPNMAIACAPEVASLLRQLHPRLKAFEKWEDCPPYRAFVPLSGLPRLHGTRVGNVPAPIPYLRADPERVAVWRERLLPLAPPSYRRVGIVWAGRPSHNNDRRRSASLALFAPIAALPRVAVVSLQKGPSVDQAGKYFGRAPLINIGAEIQTYEDTMALLECLDVVVTVDTSVGHLTAAMGKPAWIMLARAPDWRWLLDRDDSPWYPTVRLFRQTEAHDWTDVVKRVAAALRERFEAPPAR